MNKLLEECLITKTKRQGLQEGIFALQKQQEENEKKLNEFALQYIREHFPEKVKRMIEPKNPENKQFFVHGVYNRKCKDSFREGVYHDGMICFSVLIEYEEYQEYDGTFYDPVYLEGVIYGEDLPKDE